MEKRANAIKRLHKRVFVGVMTWVLVLAQLPAWGQQKAGAAEWMRPSLDKLVSWNVLRGDADGSLHEDEPVTRAEFASMVNRAYGYDKTVAIPFTDITGSEWYADDIAIGYGMGYYTGTSDNTASPNATLTREQAVTMLGRNMLLDEIQGEVTEFTDGRDVSAWSSGMVRTAAALGIIKGYPDGSFHPQENITRGEAASLLANALGSLINTGGDYSPGEVYSNLTISASGVTLRDTTILGNLYLTGGLDAGSVRLENVTVLGKIVVCGGGESANGENSIILRNVTAGAMQVESLTGRIISIQADGDTVIDAVRVRTQAYLEDRTDSGMGFLLIEQDGEAGMALTLAGNIEQVVNKTPNSTLTIAAGEAALVNIDETATGSTVTVERGAVINTLNLDVGATVSGAGAIGSLTANAAGSTSAILPDTITIRPGITAKIAGEEMNTQTGAESSETPRLLSGYPEAKNVLPTGLTAVFSANKSGTVYWAVTTAAVGQLEKDELVTPALAPAVVKSGSVAVAASSTEVTASVSGLAVGSDYYLSAVLMDKRGQISKVKSVEFTTPDNTVPAFASGYPYMSKVTNNSAQVTVMATKSCKLYYILLPKGSAAPAAKDFTGGDMTGSLGYGEEDLTKNTTAVFTVNKSALEEVQTYDLYLMLSDADGARSSAVKKLTFTTLDKTPPVFNTEPTVTTEKTTAIVLTFNLNEDGTVYWAAVKSGAAYPKPLAGQGTGAVALDSDSAKLQVASGSGALKSGSVSAKADKDGTITVSGLESQTAYDIYYVAKDKAGNYSAAVKYLTANTEDASAPTVTQEFTQYSGTDGTSPLANTDIRLVFSESVMEADAASSFSALYDAVTAAQTEADLETAKAALASALSNTISLYISGGTGAAVRAAQRTTGSETDWVIDYRNATVTMEDKKMVVTLSTADDDAASALHLSSGVTYYFQLQNITDTSTAHNRMGTKKLDSFTTAFAQVNLTSTSLSALTLSDGTSLADNIDMSFQLVPAATDEVDDEICWDMLVWCDTSSRFELYRRVKTLGGVVVSDWEQLGGDAGVTNTGSTANVGLSMTWNFITSGGQPNFQQLNALSENQVYEYAIRFTELEGERDRSLWSKAVNCKITAAAGKSGVLGNLSADVSSSGWTEAQAEGAVSIGVPSDFSMKKQFTDKRPPEFTGDAPVLEPADIYVNMTVQLDRSATGYYVVAKQGLILTKNEDGTAVDEDDIPWGGGDGFDPPALSAPSYLNIVNPKYSNTAIKTGSFTGDTGASTVKVSGLEPETEYYVYFVLKGTGQVYSDVLCYRFETGESSRPAITLDLQNPTVSVSVSEAATVNYALLVDGKLPSAFNKAFSSYVADLSGLPSAYAADSYTVLDAMIDEVWENKTLKGSVFDVYASQSAKETFGALIRNQKADTVGAVAMADSATVAKNAVKSVNCKSYLSGDTWYCFLAVARGTQSTNDGFRAIRPVYLVDTDAPMVMSCTTSIDFSAAQPPKTLSEASSRTYSGSMILVFDEQLYKITHSGTSQTITPLEAMAIGSTSSGYVSLATVLSLPSSSVDYDEGTGSCSSIRFSFKNLSYNGTITLSQSVCDENGNVHTVPLILTLNVTSADSEGNYIPYFTVTAAWDGRS